MAPDMMLDTWSAGYRVAPAREQGTDVVVPPDPLAGVDVAWSSDHRPVGIFVAAGPHLKTARPAGLNLFDLCPTSLALLAQQVPDGLDGRAAESVLSRELPGRAPGDDRRHRRAA